MSDPGFELDRHIAVRDAGDGRFTGTVDEAYSIGPYPNGGYLLAIAVNALRQRTPLPDPVAVSAHYVRPAQNGIACEVVTEVVRAGRGHATLEASLRQEGRTCMRVLATFGDLGAATGPTLAAPPPPSIPPLEECIPDGEDRGAPMPNGLIAHIRERFEARYDPACIGWRRGEPSGDGVIQGWLRFRDGRPVDTLALMLVCDAMPPAVFNLVRGGWVPTLELTCLVRARPAEGWMRCRFTTRHVRAGYLEEDGEVWDEDGVLVCQSRQLARVLPPPDAG